MRRTPVIGFAAWMAIVLASAPSPAEEQEELSLQWSLSPSLQYHYIESPEDDDDVTGFFDQYEFVPNKSSSFPLQLGIRDAALDLFSEGETPVLQLRLNSPTSNLGLSGSEAGDPFFNQRALALGRFDLFDFDLRYWRSRTEMLRLFPNTAEGARTFEDLTDRDDRFARERTGFRTELRAGVFDLLGVREPRDALDAPRLSLRGGYETRQGDRQRRFMLEPSNRWTGITQERDQHVGELGGGVLLAPWRLLTLSLDFDHERFREDESPLLRSALGGGAPAQGTIGFVPDTDRYTGTALLRSRLGERVVLEGGFQSSYLEQVEDFTPLQDAAGLRDNSLLQTSARFAADVALLDALSLNASLKYEQRDNDLERHTTLFNSSNGTQPGVFLERLESWRATAEAVYRFDAGNRLAAGARFAAVDRDLEFSQPGIARVLPLNTLVSDESESYTFYGKGQLRLLRRVSLTGEAGYQIAPETGYLTDLDDRIYGKLRAAYTLPLERAVVVSFFARGGSGESDEQVLVSGVGENPAGTRVRRRFDRDEWLAGLTASAAPSDTIGLFASIFVSQDAQDNDLVLSSLQRYLQPLVPVTFSETGSTDYQDDRVTVVVGTHVALSDETDAALSYSFTRSETEYDGSAPRASLIARYREVDADIHGLDLELGHWLF
jgi:hypothetical protein